MKIAICMRWVFAPTTNGVAVDPRHFRVIIDGFKPIGIEERICDRLGEPAWVEVYDVSEHEGTGRVFAREKILRAALVAIARAHLRPYPAGGHIDIGDVQGKDVADL